MLAEARDKSPCPGTEEEIVPLAHPDDDSTRQAEDGSQRQRTRPWDIIAKGVPRQQLSARILKTLVPRPSGTQVAHMNPHNSPKCPSLPQEPNPALSDTASSFRQCQTPITKLLTCPTLSFTWGPGPTPLLALAPSLAQTPSAWNWVSWLARAKARPLLPRNNPCLRPRKHHRPKRPKGPRHPLKRAPTPSQACPPGSRNTTRVHGLRTKPPPVSTWRAPVRQEQFTPPIPSLLVPTPPLAFRVSRYGI